MFGVHVVADACLDEAQVGTPSQQNTPADQLAGRGQAGTTWAGDGEASGAEGADVREDRVSHVNPSDVPASPTGASVMNQTSFGAGVVVGAAGTLLISAAM